MAPGARPTTGRVMPWLAIVEVTLSPRRPLIPELPRADNRFKPASCAPRQHDPSPHRYQISHRTSNHQSMFAR